MHVDDFQAGFLSKELSMQEREILAKLPIACNDSPCQTVLGVLMKFQETGLTISAPHLMKKVLDKFNFVNAIPMPSILLIFLTTERSQPKKNWICH
jgi:hypothetical protein